MMYINLVSPEVEAQHRRVRDRVRYLANPEKARARNRAWRKANPEKCRAVRHKRRARLAGNGGDCPPAQFRALRESYGDKCLCCGRTKTEIEQAGLVMVPDHVISVKMSKTVWLPPEYLSSVENFQPLCHAYKKGTGGGCNNRKGEKFIDYRPADCRAALIAYAIMTSGRQKLKA